MGNTNQQNKLSLLTFNTLGTPLFAPDITKRYKAIGRLINERDYDIVCLQEIFSYYHLFIFRKTLTAFPYVSYKKNALGPRGGVVIFSKLPLSKSEFYTYNIPEKVQFPFHTKLAQNGILSSIIEPFSIRISTTHLTSDIEHNLTPKNKFYYLIESQSQQAANIFNTYAKNDQSLIMTGDFNIAKHSALYKEFLNKTHAKDTFANDEIATYYKERLGFYFKANTSSRIDYIFYKSKQIKSIMTEHVFLEEETVGKSKKSYLSDHIGLHCILSVNE